MRRTLNRPCGAAHEALRAKILDTPQGLLPDLAFERRDARFIFAAGLDAGRIVATPTGPGKSLGLAEAIELRRPLIQLAALDIELARQRRTRLAGEHPPRRRYLELLGKSPLGHSILLSFRW